MIRGGVPLQGAPINVGEIGLMYSGIASPSARSTSTLPLAYLCTHAFLHRVRSALLAA